ncbi:MAG: thioredoxin domain-containing protein [Pseudomonadota bacterium]
MLASSRLKLAVSALAFIALPACAQETNTSFSEAQTRDIEQIVKAYLVENPDVLEEALDALAEKRNQELVAAIIGDGDDPTLGPADAPITIVEFFDYNCGFCKRSTDWVFNQLDHENGDVRVVFKELPVLDSRTGTSALAARAAIAADMQGNYRDMHLRLMQSPDLSQSAILDIAAEIGLDTDRLSKDMEGARAYRIVEDAGAIAQKAGVQGTPGFFINGAFVPGYDPNALQNLVDQARAEG